MAEDRITAEDLEAELRAVVGDPDSPVARSRPTLLLVAAAAAAAVFAIVYVMGRRAGRRRSTLLEVRRF